MRTRDAIWEELALRGDFQVESKAVINNVEYTTISAPVFKGGLLASDSLSVGNTISTTCEFTVMTMNEIPKSAQVVIKSRLSDGEENGQRSQWMDMGTFWINKRTVNDDWVDLECYDAMMKGNQPYDDNSPSVNWPKAMSTVVARICTQMGVTLDSRTVIKSGTDYKCTKPASDDTLLDLLKWIGEVHGGNWIITPENKLRLIPLVTTPPETFNVVDYDYNRIQTDDGYNLVWKIENGVVTQPTSQQLMTAYGFVPELVNVPVVIGQITTASRYSISKITMTVSEADNETTAYVAGNDTGYNLIIDLNPYATQNICNDLLTQLNGLEYAPYSVTGACFDPCIEYGDWVVVGDKVVSVLYNMEQRYDHNYRATISAPGKDEVDEEYPFQTPTQRMQHEISALNSDGEVIKSEINQMQDSITLTIAELNDKADKAQIRSQFAMDTTSVTITSGVIGFSGNTLTMSSNNFTLDSNGYLTCNGADINGELHTKDVNEEYYIDIEHGEINAGKIINGAKIWSGSVSFLDTPYGSSGTYYPGILLQGNAVNIQTTNKQMDLISSDYMNLYSIDYMNIKSDDSIEINCAHYVSITGLSGVSISGDFTTIDSGDITINGGNHILLSGDIYVDYVQSGYQGITGIYWTSQTGTQPLELNFRNGICVGVRRGV